MVVVVVLADVVVVGWVVVVEDVVIVEVVVVMVLVVVGTVVVVNRVDVVVVDHGPWWYAYPPITPNPPKTVNITITHSRKSFDRKIAAPPSFTLGVTLSRILSTLSTCSD